MLSFGGWDDAGGLDAVCEGVASSEGEVDVLGVMDGLGGVTAAPMSVSRSNLPGSPIAWAVKLAQMSAGKPPPLTRSPPPAPFRGTWAPLPIFLPSSSVRP